jgi:hypothetical protein
MENTSSMAEHTIGNSIPLSFEAGRVSRDASRIE